MAVDLHTHTIYSDGTLTPADLVKKAKELQLSAIAVTDHDSVSANKEAILSGLKYGVPVIPGVELSIAYDLPGSGHMHLLGFFIDYDHPQLKKTLQYLRDERLRRMEKISACLRELGISITMEEIIEFAAGGSLGRPHVAALLVSKKYVSTMREAFHHYLKKGAPAYVKKVKLNVQEAIRLIKDAGGMVFIAHPISLNFPIYKDIGVEILKLRKIGLDGIELYHPGHNPYFTHWLKNFADQNEFLISGGSDFHGAVKPENKLGSGNGSLNVDDQVYYDLVAYHKKKNN